MKTSSRKFQNFQVHQYLTRLMSRLDKKITSNWAINVKFLKSSSILIYLGAIQNIRTVLLLLSTNFKVLESTWLCLQIRLSFQIKLFLGASEKCKKL